MRGTLIFTLAALIALCFPHCTKASAQRDEDAREQRILQIQQRIEDHDLAGAARLLTAAAKQFPADAGFDNLSGIVQAQQGNYRAAEQSFSQAVKRAPRFTGAYLNLGRLYQENLAADPQARRKALATYGRVLGYDAKNVEANFQSAVLLLQEERYQDSLNHVTRLPAEVRSNALTLSITCADHAGLGDRGAADEAAARLAAHPDFSELHVQEALPGLRAGKRDDLIISFLETLQSRARLSPEMLRALGLAYESANRLADARAAIEKSVTKETLSVPLLLELARIAHKQKDYQGSLGYLAHAKDLEPENASLHYYFGLVCVDLNLVAEAGNAFEKAVKLDPENASYNYAMGAASAYRHDPAEAVPYFEKYIKLKPQDPRGKLALGVALFRAKDYEAAGPPLTDAANIPETATAAHYYLGSIALQEGRLDEALTKLQQALKSKPDYLDALAELGQYHLLKKDYGQAEKCIRHALDVAPDHFKANFYLLTLYTRTGDSRREEQAKRFEELQKLRDEQTQEFMRIIEVSPFPKP